MNCQWGFDLEWEDVEAPLYLVAAVAARPEGARTFGARLEQK